jgi:hypothetical protein
MVSGPNGSRVVRRLRLVRNRQRCRLAALTLLPGLLAFFLTQAAQILGQASGLAFFPDSLGALGVYSTGGTLDTTNPFFQVLGTNGRSCDTCHKASDGYSITPAHIQDCFAATKGADPMFRPNDGSPAGAERWCLRSANSRREWCAAGRRSRPRRHSAREPAPRRKGFAMVYNPLEVPVTRTLILPLYYTGLKQTARIREQEGEAREVRLNNTAEVEVTVSLVARGLTWFVIE